MKSKWSNESPKQVYKLKYAVDDLQQAFELIEYNHQVISGKVEGINDFKVLGHGLELHLKTVQEMVLELALKTDQNIEF